MDSTEDNVLLDEQENSNLQFPEVYQQPEEDCDEDGEQGEMKKVMVKKASKCGDDEKGEQETAEMYEIENEDHINMALEAGEDNEEDFREGLDNEGGEDNDHEKQNEDQEEGDGQGNFDEEDDDESDDDVKITIGDITANPASYTAFNVKRGAPGSAPQGLGEKSKFTIDEFDGSMAINGVPAHEFSVDSLEEKPWRKPGADITDYFNYGFNESTWQAYCERQRRMRMESGAGVPASLGLGPPPKMVIPPAPIPIAVVNENSKYAGSVMVKKAGPPPARKMAGAIDVIGGGNLSSRRPESGVSPSSPGLEESTEQSEGPPVAEKPPVSIDFSRPPPGFPNMALPPPFGMPPPVIPPPMMMQPPPIVADPYAPEFLPGPGAPGDDYYQYEPTQDSQWGTSDWRGPPPMGILPMGINASKAPGLSRRDSMGTPPVPGGEESRTSSSSRRRRSSRSRSPKDDRDNKDKELEKDRSGKDRERDRDRDRDREKRSDRRDRGSGRDRERSDRDRERDRSDRRRRKSRSRSPNSSHKRSSKRSKRDRSKSKSSSD